MTNEQIKALNDEQLKELGLMRIPVPETTEAPAEKSETQEAPETVLKSELDAETAKLTAEIEALKKENDILLKSRGVKPNTDAKPETQITKEQFERMPNEDKHNFRIDFPEIYKKYTE